MSKKVAASYLDKVLEASSTLTVYFTNEQHLSRFTTEVQQSHGEKVSCRRGFDYVLFISTDHTVVDTIQAKAKNTGLDYSGL